MIRYVKNIFLYKYQLKRRMPRLNIFIGYHMNCLIVWVRISLKSLKICIDLLLTYFIAVIFIFLTYLDSVWPLSAVVFDCECVPMQEKIRYTLAFLLLSQDDCVENKLKASQLDWRSCFSLRCAIINKNTKISNSDMDS